MASFFDDFQERKKKNNKKVMQMVTPSTAVKTSKETKKAIQNKVVTPKAKSYVSKNTKRSFAGDFANRKKVSLPTVTMPTLPGRTMNGSLRTPIRVMQEKETRDRMNQLSTKRKARAAQLDRQKLSEGDKTLNPVQQRAIQSFKADWEAAKARGDAEGMAMAHVMAEQVRRREGFSGGPAGDQFISPELSAKDKATLNQSGQIAMKQAKLDYDRAAASGDQMEMRDAILRMTALRKDMRNQNGPNTYGMDAYGRTMSGGAMTRDQMAAAEKRLQAGLYSTMAAIPGSAMSFFETTNQAIENDMVERNRKYLQEKANRRNEYKVKLDMVRAGKGNPDWGSESWLEQQLRIAENAQKLLTQGTIVDPNLPGQTLMRKSSESAAEALEGLEGIDRDLAQALMSVGQNLPSMALSAIPGVGPAIGAGVMGLQAAGARAWELNEQTAQANNLARIKGGKPEDYGAVTPAEASFRGLLSGFVEAGTEKIGLDRLGKLLTGKAGKNIVKNILAQMGIEGTEESVAYTANYFLDKIAKDPNAEWTPTELWDSFRLGAIAGGMMAGPAQLIGNAKNAPENAQENARRAFNGTNVRNSVENVESGLVRDDYTNRQDQRVMDEIDAASKMMGVQVGFQARTPGGMPRAQGNQIVLEQGTQAPARFLFGRQLAGWMEQAAPESYGEFKEIIRNEPGVQNQVRAIMEDAKDLGMAYTEEQALNQVAADYAGTLMENDGVLRSFTEKAKSNKPLLQQMSDGLRSLGQRLTGRQAQKAQNAAEALELAMHETIKGNRLLTGKEQRIKNRQMAQAQRWDLDRRDAITEQMTRGYQENTLPAEARARIDQVGIEGVVDEYLNGNLPANLREFGRTIEAYEELNRNYSFLRPEEYSSAIAEATEVARQLGLNLEMADQVAEGRANAEIEGNTVRIEKWNPNPVRFLFGHEMTHYLQEKTPDSYNQFRDHVMQTVGPNAVQNKIQEYADHGVELTTDQAIDEIVADYAGQLVENRDMLNKFIQNNRQNKTLLERVLEAIRNLAAKLTGKKKTQAEEAAALLEKAMQEVRGQVKQGAEVTTEVATEARTEARTEATTEASDTTSDTTSDEVKVGDEAATYEEDGKRYSIKSLNHDIAEGKMFEDLVTAGVFTKAQATRLRKNLNDLIDYMLPNANILDMNEAYGKGNRPYKAYKPNSDPLYVISLDFSTLCRKRLMTQYVIEQLQLRENRPMTAEEQLAIRSMLLDYRKQEQALQVACAMCYVESARLKAPKQMETYFKSTESVLTKYFAMKNKDFNDKVKKAQEDFKTERGYDAKDPKSAMTTAERKAFDQMSDRMRKGYEPTAEEKAIIETAKGLPRSTYLTAANLTKLNVEHPEIYDAYTTYIRNATRSKSLESDIPYYYGDSREAVTDGFIEKVNAENGMRFDSWSDFQMEHMLDMITAVIDLSVRGSKMHGYTKFPEMVRIFGKTGMQFNLSGVTEGNGFDEKGNLVFSDIEGMSKEDAIKLRKDFPETAGFQCIGVSDDHIRALLRADYIDYVIPYHISGLNKTMRRMAGIYKWEDYTKEQHATKDHKAKKPEGAENWQVEPVWSEFYTGEGENGLDIMQKTAQRYVDMCHERGLIPKFDKFRGEPGYWKLLVDRKMVNQKTGKIIEQQPVRPDFDFKTIKKEIDREVASYDPSLEQRALDYVVEHFDAVNTRIQDLKKQGPKEQKTKKQMQNLGNEMLQAVAEGVKPGVRFSLKAHQSEIRINVLKDEITYLQEQIEDAEFFEDDPAEIKRLRNQLTKARGEYDKLLNEERKAAKLTSLQEILDNLDNYRLGDLHSLAEQISASNWDDYEELSPNEMRDALREVIENLELSPLEMQSKKYGYYVRPPETKSSLKTTRRDTSGSDYERAYEMVYGKQGKPKTVEQAANQEAVGVIDRLQNLETPKTKTKAKPLPKPGERKVEAVQEDPIPAEDLAYMDELVDAAVSPNLEAEFQAARDMIPGGKVDKTPLGEKGKDIGGYAYRKFVDSGDEIRKAGKQSGDKYLYFYYNQAKASTATAQNMIAMRQSDVNGKEVGESLVDIFGPIKKKGQEYFKDFQDYLLHRHNIHRMGTDKERAMQKQATRYLWDFEDAHPEYKGWTLPEIRDAADDGDQIAKDYLEIKKEKAFWDSKVKPVFSYDMTPEKSRARVRQYEGSHPEFKDLAERVYAYNRNLMQYRVDSGLISKDTAEFLQKRYPDYVPTFHQQDGVSTAERGKGTKVGKTVKKATGNTGNNPFVDMDKAMAQQTMSVVRESAKNRFGQRLLNEDISQDYIINVESPAQQKALAELHDEDGFKNEQTNKDNTFTVYKDGKAYEITMTPAMYDGIKSLSKTGESDKLAIKTLIGANNVYKKLITAWNPLFTVKNFLKDLQDAFLYTGDAKAFAKNYPKAFKQIFGNGDEWKLYQALGGTASSVYETEKGVQLPTDNVAAKVVGKVAFLNQAIEQAPRLAEFMATADKGNRTQEELMEAMYKAADITTNFGRSGDVTKMLNSSFVPFLNPSIQGVDKLVRTARDNPRAVGPIVGLIGKAAILGVAPAIINAALFGDEDDYDELNQRDKDNNFMIPLRILNEEWDGMWLRFPRGRALAAVGAITNAGMNKVQGKDVDMIDLVTTVWGNIGVVNPMTSNIARPLMQTALLDPENPGKTWYGGDIETQAMQNKEPGERYNEKTDVVSKFVGGKLGVSPAKINYLLDSYTGVVGDLALPLLTPTNPVGKNPLSKAFVTDSTTSNRLSGDFYEMGDQLKYDEQDGDTSATIAYNYWSKVSQDLSKVNEEIRKMENDMSLDSKAKRKKYRDLKAQANEIIREGMANVDAFRKAAEEYEGEINEDTEWDVLVELTRDVLGAEKALEYDGKDTYEKAQEVVKEGGSYESYYDYLQAERLLNDIMDAESNLNTLNERNITGDKLTEAQNEVDLLNKEHQDLVEKSLIGSNGWKPTSTDRKLSVLESLELPEKEAFAIWKMKILDSEQRYKMEVLEEAGLPQMDYFRYKMAVKHLNGYEDSSEPGTTKRNSKKDMRVPIINSLDLTPAQKDILYLDVENWAKSGLHKTPWH